jgi:hypothetical protein
MSINDLNDPRAVHAALDEFDQLGRNAFLDKYGFGRAQLYFIVRNGKRYDSKAIIGAAYGFQYPERGARRAIDFSGGEVTVVPLLEGLGFTVDSDGTRTAEVSRILADILSGYLPARRDGVGGAFGSNHALWQRFDALAKEIREIGPVRERPRLHVKASAGQGNWARVPWVALMHEDETRSTQKGVYAVFLFREDMTGVYLTLNQGVTELQQQHRTPEARRILRERAAQIERFLPSDMRGFRTGDGIDLRTTASLAKSYEHSTIAYKLYEPGTLPSDADLADDLEVVLAAYDRYLESDFHRAPSAQIASDPSTSPAPEGQLPPLSSSTFDRAAALEDLIRHIDGRGWVYEPWQLAQYVAAVRTKPFLILAGITGTGKSRLPRLVAEATGGSTDLVPVRPDWTDSSEVLGYVDLEGVFRPGAVLEVASRAVSTDDVHHTLIIDEMNLARVEHYFAEILSRIEDRRRTTDGRFASPPLIRTDLRKADAEWAGVYLPANLALAGTVNMDESAHGFSRKVLDRAFTMELSEVDLTAGIQPVPDGAPAAATWPVDAWFPRATRLSELPSLAPSGTALIGTAVKALQDVNRILTPVQLQVGYRARDEVALFVLHASEIGGAFRTSTGERVDPLDLALQMKVLPRIAGGSSAVRRALLGLLGWATVAQPFLAEADARDLMERWEADGRPARISEARFPGFASRCALMLDRLQTEGFTSYWL